MSAPALPAAERSAEAPYPWRAALALGAGAILAMLPVTIIVPVLKELIADDFAAGTLATHSFMSINMIGAVLSAPLAARLCDRYARRGVMGVALVVDAAMFAAMALAPTLPLVLTARLFEGAAHVTAISALMAAAADLAPPTRRGRVMGVVGGCMMLGTALGVRFGGLIWRQWPDATFEAAAGLALLAAGFAVVALPRGPRSVWPPRERRPRAALLRSRPALLVPYAFTFVDRFCVGVIISTFVLLLAAQHGLDPDRRSALLAMFMAPFALLVYPAGRLVDRWGAAWPLAGGSALFGVILASYGMAPAGWLPAIMVTSGVLSALMFAPTLTLCADLTPPEQRGAAYAGFNAAGSLGFIAGPLVAGGVTHLLTPMFGEVRGYQTALAVAGLAEVLCAAVAIRWLRAATRSGAIRGGRPGRAPSVEIAPGVAVERSH